MVKICVFDTETTGLPPILDGKDWNARNVNDGKLLNFADLSNPSSVWKHVLSSWPSIIQLSYIVYDLEMSKPDDITIDFAWDNEQFIQQFSVLTDLQPAENINLMPTLTESSEGNRMVRHLSYDVGTKETLTKIFNIVSDWMPAEIVQYDIDNDISIRVRILDGSTVLVDWTDSPNAGGTELKAYHDSILAQLA
jgi:hypothetical protein